MFSWTAEGQNLYLALIINDDLPLLSSKTLQGNGWSTNIYRYSYCQSLCSRLPGFDSELVQGVVGEAGSVGEPIFHTSLAPGCRWPGCQCRCACSAATGLLGRATAMDCCFRLRVGLSLAQSSRLWQCNYYFACQNPPRRFRLRVRRPAKASAQLNSA